jgi:holliday junction resolvase Hjr
MNTKAKGTKGERELVNNFNYFDWSAIRVAGSGSSRNPSPDVLAGNGFRRIALECKVTKDNKKYLTDSEIDQLIFFSQRFGAEAWIGIKFPNFDWFFLMPEDLIKTKKSYLVSEELVKRKGLSFKELIKS